uniref:B30.2/SPRY domain-containing protein n=2 Tax=Periophthalmus magnuspinnatus TaxID=409849 RepID=A0A3B3ZNK9_9GOBI
MEALIDIPLRLSNCTNLGLAMTQNPLLGQQPITREQYLNYAVNISLDPNTAHRRLVLSEENCKISVVKQEQDYPAHPARFSHVLQALSNQELTGRRYFEVQWQKQPKFLGFTYKKIGRKGKRDDCILGMNDKSWALHFYHSKTSLWHNGEEVEIMSFYKVNRVGVYLDQTAGNISFYDVDQEMCQLAKVQTVFQKPVYVAARFTEKKNSLEFVKLK